MKLQTDENKMANEYRLQGGQSDNSHYLNMTGSKVGGQFRTPIKLTTNQQMQVLAKRGLNNPDKYKATLNHEPRDSSLTKHSSGGANVFQRQVDLMDGRLSSTIKKNQSYLKINVKN
jgi:hypothetical protein